MNYLLFKFKESCLKYNWLLKCNKVVNNFFFSGRFEQIVTEVKKLSIFDYKRLAMPMMRYYTDFIPENNDKNMGRCLKEYRGVNVQDSLNAMIEHGVFFGDYVADREYILNVPSIITFGDSRIQHLTDKGVNKQIIPIGPYIHYASPLLAKEEFLRVKQHLGRVLLVFPSHSLDKEGFKSQYNIKEFTDEIDRVARDFDTVLISLHYDDVSRAVEYEKRGFICVSSGHTNDPFFMHRQRSIIELSDVTMSNAVGTHVGYCIYLKKPHYLFKQKIGGGKDNVVEKLTKRWCDDSIYEKEVSEVESAFDYYSSSITEYQFEIANKYWGFEYIKTPEKLKEILSFSKI